MRDGGKGERRIKNVIQHSSIISLNYTIALNSRRTIIVDIVISKAYLIPYNLHVINYFNPISLTFLSR